ncbi:MarR family transcriptional regulator [Cupriavidus basilensis]|uniref:MarR family transcriptional regulator n=1 Tax=Cupriavidus basilensis TaxID=68895 RepID=A0ABT6AME8_9BURK|nr:MarR family transcriptional regulator [Cupriavidus basilensis]MDF3833761.1 MarR family transcriptional regulator [Cupriavidus basilensis]
MATPRTKKAVNAVVQSPVAGQETANPVPPRIPYLIARTDRIVKRRLSEVLAPHGITLTTFTAMSVLHARGRLSNAQLAERSFMSPQSANEIVKMMEANGWIIREPDPTHGRIIKLGLTEDAQTLLMQCDKAVKQLETEMLDGIDPQHVSLLRQLLTQCVRNLRY